MKRLPYLDYARVFVAYLVIFGHLITDMPGDFLFAFRMPFFFLVSGMLHKFNGTIQWKKYLRLIIPIVWFNLFYLIVVNPIYMKTGVKGNGEVITYLACIKDGLRQCKDLVFNLFKKDIVPCGPSWFLFALIHIKLLTDAVKIRPMLFGALYVALCVVVMGLNIRIGFVANALMAFPFYYVGAQFKPYIEKKIIIRQRLLFALLCLISVFLIVLYNGRTSIYSIIYGYAPHPINVMLFYVAGFVGSLMVLFIFSKSKTNKNITYASTTLITILCMQNAFCMPYKKFYAEGHYGMSAIVAVAILLACVGIHWLIMKYCPFILGKKKCG